MKPLVFVGSAQRDLRDFPDEVRSEIGYALYLAQNGETHRRAKLLKGLPAVEIVSDHASGTYRAVYTAKFEDAVYVLHAFQKKSKSGIATPRRDMALIEERLKQVLTARRKGDI